MEASKSKQKRKTEICIITVSAGFRSPHSCPAANKESMSSVQLTHDIANIYCQQAFRGLAVTAWIAKYYPDVLHVFPNYLNLYLITLRLMDL